jgi:UDP-GlcNAc:undecaprenyl-phosphate GlcNAc-1-phosphate transferase
LKPWQKLVGQIAAAVAAYFAGFGVYVLRGDALGDCISFLVSVVWLVGCANAFNLIDGLDGLAAGVGTFAALTTLVAALAHGHIELAIVTAPLVGSLLGFLRYNFNPASIFLGDCGSLSIGFLLGCYAAAWGQKSATALGMTAPLMALALPLLDTGLAIIRRLLRRQPVFGADRSHIHHRLLDQGLTTRRVALLLYAACGLGAALSLLQDFGSTHFGGLIVILFCIVAWIGIQHLGYAEFAVAGRLLFRGTLRTIIDTQVRLAAFEQAAQKAATPEEFSAVLVATATEFGFTGVRVQLPGTSATHVCISEAPPDAVQWDLMVGSSAGAYARFTYSSSSTRPHPNLTLVATSVQKAFTMWANAAPEQTFLAAADA